jgi:hypothetical protein
MSLSADSLGLHRKRTATDHAANNGDPLVVRKKAREATKSSNTALANVTTATEPATAPKKKPNICQHFVSALFLILPNRELATPRSNGL